jgi:hypothetical protein
MHYPTGLAATGAFVFTRVDPDDVPEFVGLCACTGALVLTNVPVVPEPPELVPLPVVLTGAVVFTRGDRDEAGGVVAVVAEPLSVPPAGAGLADVVVVPGVALAMPADAPCVPTVARAAGDAEQALAKAGVVEDSMVIPAPASPRRDALRAIARARLVKVFIEFSPFEWFSRSLLVRSRPWGRSARQERLTRRGVPQGEDGQRRLFPCQKERSEEERGQQDQRRR